MTRSIEELEEAVSHVNGEWALLAEMASLLPQSGERSPAALAALEATLVHARCLINFCCGGYAGSRTSLDIQPADFLGVDWWPRDEDFERKLRGRVLFINQELQHLSWQRVLDKAPLIVSATQIAHEVHWGMHLFVEELRATGSDWLERFELQEQYVSTRLPVLGETGDTVPHLAPTRSNPTPP